MIIQYKNQILIYCFNFFIQLFIFLCKNTNPIFLRSNLNIIVLFKFFTDNNLFFYIALTQDYIIFFIFREIYWLLRKYCFRKILIYKQIWESEKLNIFKVFKEISFKNNKVVTANISVNLLYVKKFYSFYL